MHKPNNLLEKDVRDELHWDPLLDDTRIVVKVDDGRVTLNGAVALLVDVDRASWDAWGVGGVKAVDNELLVGTTGAAIMDSDIQVACAAALDADKRVPRGAVSVEVTDGWATLRGRVPRHLQRQSAQHAVGKVAGVLGVTDLVTISDEPVPSDVSNRINNALGRKAITSGSDIKVSSVGHTVYLDGATGSWAAMVAAEDTAWKAPGVSKVINRLSIV